MPSISVTPKRSKKITQHGQTRIDDYFWLRYKEDPEVLKYLHAEQDFLEEITGHTKSLQETLFQEMKARIKENDSSAPEKDGNYFYFTRYEQSKQYPFYCRKKRSLNAAEDIFLDQNTLVGETNFCRVGAYPVSPDASLLAYSIDVDGSEI